MATKSNTGSQSHNKRRIMLALKINEISGVDVPAQEGATAVIMKRRHLDKPADRKKKKKKSGHLDNSQTDDLLAKGAALTTEEQGFTHLVILNGPPDGVELSSGETTWQDGHNHPWVRTTAEEIILGVAESSDGVSHIHTIQALSKSGDNDGIDNNNPAAGETGKINKETNMADKINKEGGEPTVEELQTQLARANSVGSLNDAEKTHFKGLEGADADTFLAKSADERTTELAALSKAAGDDPVEYITMDGIELKKSAGAAFIAMAKSNDTLRKRVDKSEAELENASLEKRATKELAHIPGDLKVRVSMLKAIEGIEDDSQREAAMNILKAQNENMGKAFTTMGHGGGNLTPNSVDDEMDNLAKAYNKENPELSEEQAYSKALKTPKGQELYAKSLN